MFAGIMKRFAKDEDGAVTVDYVVLTAVVVVLALGAGTYLTGAVNAQFGNIANEINGAGTP